jgi:hypothetical protein
MGKAISSLDTCYGEHMTKHGLEPDGSKVVRATLLAKAKACARPVYTRIPTTVNTSEAVKKYMRVFFSSRDVLVALCCRHASPCDRPPKRVFSTSTEPGKSELFQSPKDQ